MGEMVLRSQPATISATFYDTSGEVVDPGAVTVTVTGADGTAIVTAQAASGSGETTRTYPLTASHTAQLDILSYTFTSSSLSQSVTGEVEVVGAYLFSIAEARAFHDGALASDATYTDAMIEDARERITEAFEERCEVSFIRRYRRTVVAGRTGCALLLPDYGVYVLRALETRDEDGWTAWTEDELAYAQLDPIGQIILDTGYFYRGNRNYRIAYEYGWAQPPGEIKRAALELARYQLVASNISDRTTSISSDAGTFSLATAGTQGAPGSAYRHYGLPNVDSTFAEYWRKLPRGR